MKKKLSILSIILCFFLPYLCWSAPMDEALDKLAEQITSEVSGKEKQKVAVVDFSDLKDQVTRLGTFISEEVLTRLAREGKVSIVERKYLKKAIEETGFKASGIVDVSSAQKIGKFLGADAICIGTMTILRTSIKINARLIDADTGRVFAAASVTMDRNTDIDSLIDKSEGSHESPVPPEVSEPAKKPKPRYKKGNLVINGDFSRNLASWKRQIGDITKGYSQAEVISFPHGRSGKALHMSHKGEGHIQYSQPVPVPGADLYFSASFQAHSHEGNMIGFSGSGVVQIGLVFLDETGTRLGDTVLVNYVKNPFADTPLIGVPRRANDTYKTHYVEFSKGKFNQDYRINIRQEIEGNLMGIDPNSVSEIVILLWCGATNRQAGSELWVTDIRLIANR